MYTESDKFLFLDIDGCLTSFQDGTSYLSLKPENYEVSDTFIELIKRIINETGCKIIISSNWRRFPTDGCWLFEGKVFHNPLPKLYVALGKSIDGDLTHERHLTKSEALTLWFEDNDLNSKTLTYAIIDDDYDEGFTNDVIFNNNYFHCDYHTGLTEELADKIIAHLNHA